MIRADLTDEHAKATCKIGQGAACCRYLTMAPDGWCCEKHSELRVVLDVRAASGEMSAQADNCEGVRA